MPNFYAHLRLCRTVARQAPPELRTMLEREEDAYICGGFGPDPLYFYIQGLGAARIRQAGTELHHHTGAAAMEPFRRPVKEGWPYAASFAAGYLLHYLLDARCHPFVNAVARQGRYTHFALEGEYDRYLLCRDGLDYPTALPQRELPPGLYRVAARMAEPVTPEIYRRALADFRYVALRLGRWAGTPVRHAFNAVSHIPAVRPIRGMVLGPQIDPKLQRYMLSLDRLWSSAAETAQAELERFFHAVEQDLPFSETLGRDFRGNKEE